MARAGGVGAKRRRRLASGGNKVTYEPSREAQDIEANRAERAERSDFFPTLGYPGPGQWIDVFGTPTQQPV